MSNSKIGQEKPVSPKIAESIRDLAVMRRNSTGQSAAPMTTNPQAIALQKRQLESRIERATGGGTAEVTDLVVTGIEGMHAIGNAEVMSALMPLGIAVPVIAVLDMNCMPVDIVQKESLALNPDDQNDPSASMIPR